MRRLLITGASGFVGSHCLRRAVASGGFDEIHAVSRSGRGEGTDATWHAADLRDEELCRKLIAEIRPTHLLHGAWIATPGIYIQSPENLDWLRAGIALAQAFGDAGGRRLVGIGSSAEYDPDDTPCLEDATPVRPSSIYGKCKAACWLGMSAAAQHFGFSAAWGRLFLPYGPGEPDRRLVPSVIATLRAGEPVETTEGTQARDFIHVEDAADLLVRLLESELQGACNVGTGVATTVRDVVLTLADAFEARDKVRFGAVPMRSGEPSLLVADLNRAEKELGWRPAIRVEDGLGRIVAAGRSDAG